MQVNKTLPLPVVAQVTPIWVFLKKAPWGPASNNGEAPSSDQREEKEYFSGEVSTR